MAKMGRPTKYKEEFIALVDEYLADPDECKDKESEFHKTRGDSSNTFERIQDIRIPSIQNFSLYSNIPLTTIQDWEATYKDFSVAIDKIRRTQHKMLVNGGASGRYATSVVNLMLGTNHGYRERKDITSGDKPIPILGDLIG